jgi:hypothetical protein
MRRGFKNFCILQLLGEIFGYIELTSKSTQKYFIKKKFKNSGKMKNNKTKVIFGIKSRLLPN